MLDLILQQYARNKARYAFLFLNTRSKEIIKDIEQKEKSRNKEKTFDLGQRRGRNIISIITKFEYFKNFKDLKNKEEINRWEILALEYFDALVEAREKI